MCAIAGQIDMFAASEDDFDADLIDDGDLLPVTRRVLPAKGQPVPMTFAPRSVFEMASMMATKLKLHGRFGAASGFDDRKPEPSRVVAKVDLGNGRTKVVGANYPPRWTEHDVEKERQRRARQKPPKPTKKAKTRGRKLLELIGDDNDD